MDTPPLFDVPEPPADETAAALEALRNARRELDHARSVVRLLDVDPGAAPRAGIEQQVATRRVELWRAEVASSERRARSLGLDVSSVL